MPLLQWIPAAWQPFTLFLIMIGLLSVGYTLVFTTVSGIFGKLCTALRIPADGDRILRVLIGHPLLTALTILTTMAALSAAPQAMALYTSCAAAFLWITMAPELYDEYGGTVGTRTPESRIFFVVQFALILLWITATVLAFDQETRTSVEAAAGLSLLSFSMRVKDMMTLLLNLPWYAGVLIGGFGAWSLLRSLFKALFATVGLITELPDVFRRRPSAHDVTLP